MRRVAGRRLCEMKYSLLFLLTSRLLMGVTAITTNNRIVLSSMLVGSALAASVYGYHNFSASDLALLTTAVLIMTIPRGTSYSTQPKGKTCADYPSYTADPEIGCYRMVYTGVSKPVAYADSVKECASDGGRLLLIRSEAAAKAVARKMGEKFISFAYVQGKRAGVNAPWLDDSGNPLPYITSPVDNDTSAEALRLFLKSSFGFTAAKAESFATGVLCEI